MRWIGFVVSLFALIQFGDYSRRFIRPRATFYAPTAIYVSGVALGLFFAGMVQLVVHFMFPFQGWWPIISFTGVGVICPSYLGYAPDPIDWHHKTAFISGIAMLSYAVASAVLLVFLPVSTT